MDSGKPMLLLCMYCGQWFVDGEESPRCTHAKYRDVWFTGPGLDGVRVEVRP